MLRLPAAPRPARVRWPRSPGMRARDPEEAHRASTPLELLFDLVFAACVSGAAEQLGRALADGRTAHGVGSYLLVFFAIWWAWMNFTWFSSAYEVDDWQHRATTLVVMAGALVLAAGIAAAETRDDFTVMTAGYVLMRLAMVGQWLRAAHGDPGHRRTAHRYAAGIALVQVAWVARLALPASAGLVAFGVLVLAELAVPVVAERSGTTPYHRGHIAERYGLFTLIVLGESILASSRAVVAALHAGSGAGRAAPLEIAAAGLVLVFTLWWAYFDRPQRDALTTLRRSLVWGYSHYGVFAAAGASSAGIEVALLRAEGSAHLGRTGAQAATTVPVAVFLLLTWLLCLRRHLGGAPAVLVPVLAVAVGCCALLGAGLVVAAVVAVALVTVLVSTHADDGAARDRSAPAAAPR